jgi:hypothetical protein
MGRGHIKFHFITGVEFPFLPLEFPRTTTGIEIPLFLLGIPLFESILKEKMIKSPKNEPLHF